MEFHLHINTASCHADALPLDVYLKSLQKLQRRDKEFSTLFPGHGEPIDKSFIGEQIVWPEQIIAGKCVGKPYDSFVGKGLLCGYKRAQIAYDPQKSNQKNRMNHLGHRLT